MGNSVFNEFFSGDKNIMLPKIKDLRYREMTLTFVVFLMELKCFFHPY